MPVAQKNTLCLTIHHSRLKVTDSIKEYHYTLYYYDQAGNLIKTVPPKGVVPIYRQTWIDSVETFKTNGTTLIPTHTLVTRYSYNALNQVNIQKTPDGGVSTFWYDRLGRLTISQNARQKSSGNIYSYTQYDSLGRIKEVGELTSGSVITDIISRNDASLKTWLTNAAATRSQITQTVYDTAYGPVNGVVLSQQNLRNRVSYSQLINKAADVYPASATYYSYDIHGNVDTLLQDYGNSTGVTNFMNTSTNRFKRMVYNFDLISGKVNQVSYQPGSTDAFYHKYAYDGENRLTDVYTGRDSVMLLLFPEREAHYTYYKHGPLARTDLGQLRVQGMDYAYTLQGWLKGINPTMGGTLANGTDTTEAFPTAQDAYGFSLHYYKNDYKAIGYPPQAINILGALGSNAAPLFNGNIAAMVVNIPKLGATKTYNYHYDQLNRLLNMDVFNGLSPTAGTFVPVSTTDYKEQISYDANGNILTYLRNGDAARTAMDNMTYTYTASTNKLNKVVDAAANTTDANYPNYNDIKTGQANNNYVYDAIGNLIADSSENIRLTVGGIKWNVYGKITEINKVDSATATPNNRGRIKRISYTYDAAGNRIGKRVTKYTTSIVDNTWYARDASGNVMSVYNYTGDSTVAINTSLYGYLQSETHLYGSSRLGIATQHAVTDSVTTLVLASGFDAGKKTIFTRGEKNMEMGNHLGNVLVTVSDKKLQHTTDNINVDYYLSDVVTANDYYSGGMTMPGRKYSSSSSSYRYGQNGQEPDKELNENIYTAEFWEYDSRLVRRWNMDPATKEYESPYACFANNPINMVDPLGLMAEDPKPKYKTLSSVIVYGKTRKKPEKKLYNPNEISEHGIKSEFLNFVDFSGKKNDLGFNKNETNNFPYSVASTDFQFGTNKMQTITSRLNNFFNGTGPTNLVYGPETQFTRSAQSSASIGKARDYFYAKFSKIWTYSRNNAIKGLNEKENEHIAKSYFGDLASRGQISVTEFKGEWGFGDIFKTGFQTENAIGNQYIGTSSINIFSSYDANRLIFVVVNSTSNYSWKLHLGSNTNRTSEIGGAKNSTILNIMLFDEPIDYSRLVFFGK
jgi:RHS repeat-associated protein